MSYEEWCIKHESAFTQLHEALGKTLQDMGSARKECRFISAAYRPEPSDLDEGSTE